MLLSIFKPLAAVVLALHASSVAAQYRINAIPARQLVEYQLPLTNETHEIGLVPGSNMVLVSQMSSSKLLKIQLDPRTQQPVAYKAFPMGSSSKSGLHGVWPSTAYPGKMWLSLQNENKLLLVDPNVNNLDAPPTILRIINIPTPGNGPHCVFEFNDRIWAGLKAASPQTGEYYVYSAGLQNPENNYKLFSSQNSPVFIRPHPDNGDVYVTEDNSNSILRISAQTGETSQIPIDTKRGKTPVGMVTIERGPLRGVWFTLAGDANGGTGTFGRINSQGQIQYFQLSPKFQGSNAALLHIADGFDQTRGPVLWLLATSLLNPNSPDALIEVVFDPQGQNIYRQEFVAMLTQDAKMHRVITAGQTVLATQLHTFSLAQLTYQNMPPGQWLPDIAAGDPRYRSNSY